MEPLRGSTNQDFSTRQMVIFLIAFFCPSIPQHLSCDHSSCDILFWHLVWVKHISWPPRPRLPNPALIIVCFCTPTPQHLRDFCGFSTLQGDHNIQSKQRSTPQHLRPFCAFSTLQGILACAPSVTAIFNPNKDKPLNIWDIFARLKFKHTCNNWATHMNGPHSENMPLSAPLWIPFLHRSGSLNKPTQISCRQKDFITVQWFSWIWKSPVYVSGPICPGPSGTPQSCQCNGSTQLEFFLVRAKWKYEVYLYVSICLHHFLALYWCRLQILQPQRAHSSCSLLVSGPSENIFRPRRLDLTSGLQGQLTNSLMPHWTPSTNVTRGV